MNPDPTPPPAQAPDRRVPGFVIVLLIAAILVVVAAVLTVTAKGEP